MRRFQLIILFLTGVLSLHGQTPMEVLDAVASQYRAKGSVEIGFTVNKSSSGTIKLSDKKFNIVLEGMEMWFDGKTLWTYVRDNMEVNVTNPTSAEIAKINPYAFVSMYKNGYKTEYGTKKQGTHHVVLKATDLKKSFRQVDLYIAKSTNRLMSVELQTRNSNGLVIDVHSYEYKDFAESTFKFDGKKYAGVDIIDLR